MLRFALSLTGHSQEQPHCFSLSMSFGFIRIVKGFAPAKVCTTSWRIASHQRLADDLAVNDDGRDRLGAWTLVLQCHMPGLDSNHPSTGCVPKVQSVKSKFVFQLLLPSSVRPEGEFWDWRHLIFLVDFYLRLKFQSKCKLSTYQKKSGSIAPSSWH